MGGLIFKAITIASKAKKVNPNDFLTIDTTNAVTHGIKIVGKIAKEVLF